MDPIENPFAPGAGSPPPELVGRDQIIEQVRILAERVKRGRSEKSVVLTGLRGVGKTVLLNRLGSVASELEYRVVQFEGLEDKAFLAILAPQLRKLLYDLDRMAGAGDKVRRGLAALKSLLSTFKVSVGEVGIGLDINASPGVADSGELEVDLPDLMQSIGEAAVERKTAVALLIDELQYLDSEELGALIVSMHRMQQKSLPLILVAAGLPTLPALAGEAKSYSERLLSYPELGPLSREDADKAVRDPVVEREGRIRADALDEIYRHTRGYPYFIQMWGYQSWNRASRFPIELGDVKAASTVSVQELDANFFRVRFGRLIPSEKRFLRGMAELGPGPHPTGSVADVLKMRSTSLGPVRASLLRKGMIYSPAHGQLAFTVPLFDEFMRRAIPDL
ncbi:MAG: AAA family ATPase [Euryarchaeota archaeon]|nr:AAA family ATPase [Euryarchaeota archaeon]MDE1837138.1 AAA family ATPase [Euryarchaeota archaeon]MDE1879650.1 AAA family ATPase [Euryarchaeota archaeon]MDE2045176.1 AAA family ATPase [Thermoplasmata archaeon]